MSVFYLEGTAALALAACAVWLLRWVGLLRTESNGSRRALVVVAAVVALALIRVDGISAARLVLTLSPSLSVTTLALSLTAIGAAVWNRPLIPRSEWPVIGALVLLISLPLFASVLGLWSVDLYVLGYRFSSVFVACAAIGGFAAWRGYPVTALIFLAATLIHYASLLPSGNLFDALTDGIAFFIAFALVVGRAASWLASRRRCQV